MKITSWMGEHATMVDTSNSLWIILVIIPFGNSAMPDLMAESICWLNPWLWSYWSAKAKCRPLQVEIIADHYLEGGKYTHSGYHQFLMNNSSNNTVCLFKHCGVNGKLNLFTRCVVVELFKFKGKMSALKIRCRSPAGGGKCTHGGHHQFSMNNSSNSIDWQVNYGGFNDAVHLLIEIVVVDLFKFKGKMSAAPQVEITADHHLEGENAPMVDTSNSSWIILATTEFGNSAMADSMVQSIGWLSLWLWSYSNLKAKCRRSKSDADHHLEGANAPMVDTSNS